MVTGARRARKKHNHQYGDKAIEARATRAAAHAARIAASAERKAAEQAEVDEFFGAPLPRKDEGE